MSTKKNSKKDADWARAKKLCRLSAEDIKMAKSLGISPKSLIKNIPSKSQQWKAPVKVWIRELHEKRFPAKGEGRRGRDASEAEDRPLTGGTAVEVRSPESRAVQIHHPIRSGVDDGDRLEEDQSCSGELDVDQDLDDVNPFADPRDAEIDNENAAILRRRREWIQAARYVAHDMGKLPWVRKVALFGSLALPLRTQRPRVLRLRSRGEVMYHEAKDIDLAVWVTAVDDLRSLQKAVSGALNRVLRNENIGVAHHQVDVFLLEPDTDRYLGRLCHYKDCPKDGKLECLVPGCGASSLLRQHQDFELNEGVLAADKMVVLYEAGADSAEDEIPF